jgi:hypothetical protein
MILQETKKIMPSMGKSLWLDKLVFVAVWLPYAALTIRFWWICDDAFISFRYARNFALGRGLRYNLGEHLPVEGYSNFLWVMICSVFEYFNANILLWPLLLSFLCGSVLLYMVFSTVRYKLQLPLLLAAIATMSLACSPSYAIWSTSGLATVPFALLIFVTFRFLIWDHQNIAPLLAGVTGLLLALMRVEGIYWAVFLAILATGSRCCGRRKFLRDILIYIGIVLAGYLIYWCVRYSYYQLPFSNTTYAKVVVNTATLERGFNYVLVQFMTVLPFFLIVPAFFVFWRKGRLACGGAVLCMPLAVIGYTILVSGDFLPMSRMLVPALVFMPVLFGWILVDIWGERSVSRKILAVALGVAVVVVGLLPGWDIHLFPESVRSNFHFRLNTRKYRSEYQQWVLAKQRIHDWTIEGKLLKTNFKPGESMVRGPIGVVGYYSDLYIYDYYGLVTREVTMIPDDGVLKSPGHDKRVPVEFFLDKKPTILRGHIVPVYHLRSVFKKMRRKFYTNVYVVDFLPTPAITNDEKPGGPQYLVLMRRIDKGIKPADAWRDAFLALSRITESSSSTGNHNK